MAADTIIRELRAEDITIACRPLASPQSPPVGGRLPSLAVGWPTSVVCCPLSAVCLSPPVPLPQAPPPRSARPSAVVA
ncbi:MAG: hypothetical protein BJ554DRAFT_7445 [Olpidium bornovanus]|uniref:Uncharacterized protein n=1 Tax=Olpidium bornovanus TaxID=278681 RepID=A0A8H7ZW51_9FUNG|nr:MAG: hypothetical protein BJ554DRAFT_7445 [Olpidium bornovanus]